MSGEKHIDPSRKWLIFFLGCFVIVLLGIVVFFARDINSDPAGAPAPAGGHGGMILPSDGEYAPHIYRLPIA